MFRNLYIPLCILLTSSISINSFAEVVINGTRIVFEAQEKEFTVQLKNKGKVPYLLQTWIDNGNPKSRPNEVKVPFIILPPIVRIDPTKGQSVRIHVTSNNLPTDRESLFWFNVLEVPPKVSNNDNYLLFALRSRIKLFYRPSQLKLSPFDAYKKLDFALNKNLIIINNPSPYYITFSKIEVREPKTNNVIALVEKFSQRMIEPYGEIKIPLSIKLKSGMINSTNSTLFYSVINDFGGETENEKKLQND